MIFDWILSPVTQYAVLALGFMSCMGLCFSTSIRVRAEQRRLAKSQESLGQAVTAVSTAVEQMRQDPVETEVCGSVACAALNLTKRAQALRMHHRGESSATIAAALQSPRNEIELLLKVHGLLNS